MVIILRGSDAHHQEYVQNKKQWLGKAVNQVCREINQGKRLKQLMGLTIHHFTCTYEIAF